MYTFASLPVTTMEESGRSAGAEKMRGVPVARTAAALNLVDGMAAPELTKKA